jgi:hypothetical protein
MHPEMGSSQYCRVNTPYSVECRHCQYPVVIVLSHRVPCCSSPGQTGIDAERLQGCHTDRTGTAPEAGDPRDREPGEGERERGREGERKKEGGEFLDLAQQSRERRGHPVGQLSLGPARSLRLCPPSAAFFLFSLSPAHYRYSPALASPASQPVCAYFIPVALLHLPAYSVIQPSTPADPP